MFKQENKYKKKRKKKEKDFITEIKYRRKENHIFLFKQITR